MAKPGTRRLVFWLQIVAIVAVVGFVTVEIVRSWSTIVPRLSDLDPWPIVAATGVLAGYYCIFVLGWMAILRAFGHRLGYPQALAASMLSMLAKYVPGGVWTPMSRVLAARRHGVPPAIGLASLGYEAGLSAISGVIVLALSLPFVTGADLPVPFWLLLGFALLLCVLLQPAIYGRAADRFLGRWSDGPIPRLSLRVAMTVLAYYMVTWLVGGLVLVLLCRSLEPVSFRYVPYLGGASALGAIAAVLVVLLPGGLGVREGAVYALLLAVVEPSTALVVVALNRILITVVEAGLLGIAALFGAPLRLDAAEPPPHEPPPHEPPPREAAATGAR